MKILDAALAQAMARGSKTLPGLTAFTLYDTYGFPLDLTADVCRERGIPVDQAGFDEAMEKQRGRGRDASGNQAIADRPRQEDQEGRGGRVNAAFQLTIDGGSF